MTNIFIHDELIDDKKEILSFQYCCPIFITGMFGTAIVPNDALFSTDGTEQLIRNGTLTFVSHKGQIYGITCRHVVESLERQNAARRKADDEMLGKANTFPAEAQAHFFFPKGDWQIHINSKFHKVPGDEFTGNYPDIAIARIDPRKFGGIGRKAIDLDGVMPAPGTFSETSCGIATGYPEQKRRDIATGTLVNTLAISSVIAVAPFGQVSDPQLSMFYELDHEPDADNLSGMSGGPILWSDTDGWGLIGIVKRGRDLKQKADNDQNSFLDKPTIWIDGERIIRARLIEWLENLPDNEEPMPDLSKVLIVPKGKGAIR